MIRIMLKKIYLIVFVICVLVGLGTGAGEAAVNPQDAGHPESVDFTYKGLALGDGVDVMRKLLGEPDYDTEMSLFGQDVIRYTYSRELRVWTDKATAQVVQIDVKDQKKYKARNDVTYGSTRYLLYRTYGEAERKMVNGKIYFIYANPTNANQRLCIDMDPTSYYLKGFIITTLPLDEEEYLARRAQGGVVSVAGEQETEADGWHRPFQAKPEISVHASDTKGVTAKVTFGSGGNL